VNAIPSEVPRASFASPSSARAGCGIRSLRDLVLVFDMLAPEVQKGAAR
jgi:hypothetical protein